MVTLSSENSASVVTSAFLSGIFLEFSGMGFLQRSQWLKSLPVAPQFLHKTRNPGKNLGLYGSPVTT